MTVGHLQDFSEDWTEADEASAVRMALRNSPTSSHHDTAPADRRSRDRKGAGYAFTQARSLTVAAPSRSDSESRVGQWSIAVAAIVMVVLVVEGIVLYARAGEATFGLATADPWLAKLAAKALGVTVIAAAQTVLAILVFPQIGRTKRFDRIYFGVSWLVTIVAGSCAAVFALVN